MLAGFEPATGPYLRRESGAALPLSYSRRSVEYEGVEPSSRDVPHAAFISVETVIPHIRVAKT